MLVANVMKVSVRFGTRCSRFHRPRARSGIATSTAATTAMARRIPAMVLKPEPNATDDVMFDLLARWDSKHERPTGRVRYRSLARGDQRRRRTSFADARMV